MATKLLLIVGAMIFAYIYVSHNVKTALETTQADPTADIGRVAQIVTAGSTTMLIILFSTTLLPVVKPWGRTTLGRRARAPTTDHEKHLNPIDFGRGEITGFMEPTRSG